MRLLENFLRKTKMDAFRNKVRKNKSRNNISGHAQDWIWAARKREMLSVTSLHSRRDRGDSSA